MRFIALIIALFGMQFAQAKAVAPDAEPVQQEFIIKNFKTESGTVLPEARIVYGTYGKLNAKGDNAILLPSHYMAEMHGYGWLIGPGKALDPTKLFLVTSELFGNGRSSSPSNTPYPFDGPRFPVTRRCRRGRWSSHVLTRTLELLNIIAQTPQFRIASAE